MRDVFCVTRCVIWCVIIWEMVGVGGEVLRLIVWVMVGVLRLMLLEAQLRLCMWAGSRAVLQLPDA